ncbi:DNA topoisomerase IV subunit B [Thomasclavelia cocleata]|uniref:DNA topoisomerase 4 subunit B n=2 Tax=Thomasclavelia cocleata TaxID=69824 RepID=A0A1I0BAI2_9FIRM|nr:DNA topoisomerase IV subunit B [Thomasclavelia cocleata]MCR1959966.1 DNA topoisomerase IV subunit B [Thomasclavelia cocleata]NDO41691.1 DNA topoisomerase IV subunit B [Thomasclavelia cocleata]GFI40439.1 DNA topoisomerase 4 subunit B [Thomasclavelia cocleata]SET03550.1 DNA topoisomerase IV subunit B [Thomasclavelia cocleata]
MAAKSNYNESNIQILEGLEAVRKRPGMYIGSTDARGLHHLVWEIVDNAIDEALSGFGDNIQVVICKDNSIEVSDHGRGMPTGMHASGRPATEVILTILHAGGKFNEDGGYKTSGGLHGVGASVVNALSSWLEVTIYREGKIWSQRFENGGSKIGKLKVIGKTNKTGTTIHFLPDTNIFSVHEYNFSTISERLMESAFLLKGIKIDLKDERNNKEVSYQYDNGLTAFVEYLNYEKEILNPIINIEGTNNGIEVDVAMQFTAGYQENTLSFVNLVRTGDGGTHETGFRVALTRTFNEYARKYGLLKEKDKNLEGNDVREGLSAIISIKVPEHFLQFEGQTKSKLGTPEARNVVDNVVYEKLSFYLEENKETADTLVKKMIKAAQVRDAARKAREAARKGKGSKQERILSGKLAPAQSKDKKRKELYLVEGDSAGGSAKQGRDRKYQAILPLRGKVVNTEKAAMSDILKNEEIATIINTIGAGVGADFNEKDSNYSKVIIMTDADTDGAHIQILLLTFFYRYMRELIIAGKVYIALPPLYKISKKNGKKEDAIYAWEDDELEEAKKKIGRGYNIQRYKGLGEMNANQLWETTMNPETRTLIQVSIDDAAIVERRVSVLMGDKVEPRREWIEQNVQFTLEDNFAID